LDRLAQERVRGKKVVYAVSAVEFLHLAKARHNVKILAGGRVTPRPGLLDEYRGVKEHYRNPLFRSASPLAPLRDRPRYACMPGLFAARPSPFFVRGEGTPPTMPWFSADAAARFRIIESEHQALREALPMTAPTEPAPGTQQEAPLELIVHRLIQQYVWR